jgi:nucleotide-binding universal stress UspA family protein
MSFKTVFTALDASNGAEPVEQAAAIASGLGAHLHVLVVGLAPAPPSSPYGVVSNDIWARDIRDGQEAADARADEVLARLRELGTSGSAEAHFVDAGTVASLSARAARYADLSLVAAGRDGVAQLQRWVMDGALFESGRPILLLPPAHRGFPRPDTVMIAWDASVEASKAVRDALELMKGAGAVHAVLIDPVPTFDGHGPEPGADLAAYLARHGIEISVHRLPREGKDTASIIQRVSRDLGADLIVMGGFGHSRLRQRIFGGTTTSMIRSVEVPVLMAH